MKVCREYEKQIDQFIYKLYNLTRTRLKLLMEIESVDNLSVKSEHKGKKPLKYTF